MTSSLLSDDSPQRVAECLIQALPTASVFKVSVDAGETELVLLHRKNILSAFAFGANELVYRKAYEEFKKYFMSVEEWRSLDVSFVYCIPAGEIASEAFCSSVEADVYFCRKFVVSLSADIATSLLRLPFLPLSRLEGSPLRPPSAQTLLQQSGVSAELARFLVVPITRSAANILSDCLAEKFGDPIKVPEAPALSELRAEREAVPVRLQSLSIRNFRAYRKTKTFDFGSHITVLYGPNGFGKTSFFDALDFVGTGGIGRLHSASSDQALAKTAKHLDSKGEPTVVSLTFQRGEKTHVVTRDLSDPKQAQIDGKGGATRKEVLTLLTGGDGSVTDRVENFVSLFRATHLFSQEQQELTRDFQSKSELSADLVSRMLAFEDYVAGIKKTGEVQALLKSAIDSASNQLVQLHAQLNEEEAELRRLEGFSKAGENSLGVETEFLNLRKKLNDIGIPLDDEKASASALRSWRVLLEGRQAHLRTLGESLEQSMVDLQKARTLTAELLPMRSSLLAIEAGLVESDKERITADNAHWAAASALSQAKSLEFSLQARCDAVKWVLEIQPVWRRLKLERAALEQKQKDAVEKETQLREQEATCATNLTSSDEKLSVVAGEFTSTTDRLQSLHALSRNFPVVVAAAKQIREVALAESDCIAKAAIARANLSKAEDTLVTAQNVSARLQREVSELEATGSEVKSLLAQLRGHVTDGICLLCGVDHASQATLIAKIDARLGLDGSVGEARNRFDVSRGEESRASEQAAAAQDALSALQGRQASLQSDKESYETVLSTFTRQASKLGISFADDPSSAEGVVASKIIDLEESVAALGKSRLEALKDRDAAASAKEDARNAIDGVLAIVSATTNAIENTQEAMSRLTDDSRAEGLDFDLDADAQRRDYERISAELAAARADALGAAVTAGEAKVAQSLRVDEATRSRKALEDAQKRLAFTSKLLSDCTSALQRIGLTPQSNDDAVLNLISENSEAHSRTATLLESSTNLEIALDAATTAAALESLRARVREHSASIKSKEQERQALGPWNSYFERISRILSRSQIAATEQFTKEYGPRTAIIQRRLRPVYGFGEVEVSSKDASIAVRVTRGGEALRPIDYFSQSQVQTLVLGLFLTACSSQTWSAFSSVLLDDPVTHFDDLNTYALLDLLSGLLQTGPDGTQFVISTCDEKFLQLARQKFKHLGSGAKFYRFSAIGAEGPLVAPIPT